MSILSIVGCQRPEDALSHLTAELDKGIVGVMVVTVQEDGMLTLTACGEVSSGDMALAGAGLMKRALESAL
jgi:hypothetical protein